MDTHCSHQGIKSPAKAGGPTRGTETLTREEREFVEAGARSGLRYPLDRQKVLRAPAIDLNIELSGLLAIGLAEVSPVDIGAKVFAADGAMSGFFDGWAVFGRNTGAPPRLQRLICVQFKRFLRSAKAAHQFDGFC